MVVLDEAQTMPLKLLRPCVAAIDELARNYRASVVLCTATQPALTAPAFEGGLAEVRELAPDPEQLFKQLERVRVRHLGALDDEALAEHMRSRDQVLCIVNNRRHARAVYQAMADLPGARHLTTLMCARHRSEVLAEVRQLLRMESPAAWCRQVLSRPAWTWTFPRCCGPRRAWTLLPRRLVVVIGKGGASARVAKCWSFCLKIRIGRRRPSLGNTRNRLARCSGSLKQIHCAPGDRALFSLLYWQKGAGIG